MKKSITCLMVIVVFFIVSALGVNAQTVDTTEVNPLVSGDLIAGTRIYHESGNTFDVMITQYTGAKDVKELIVPGEIEGHKVVGLNGVDLFKDLHSLEKVVIPESVTYFSSGTFKNCYSLKTIEGLRDDTEYWFESKSVFLNTPWYSEKLDKCANGVVMIGATVYDVTRSNGDVVIPEGATSLPDVAFIKYNEYTAFGNPARKMDFTSITIPSTMERISDRLGELSKLTSINVIEGNKDFYSKDGVLYSGDTLVAYPRLKKGKKFSVPSKVRTIKRVKSKFLREVTFESGVEIFTGAFNNCINLEKIKFADFVTFNPMAFVGTKLKTVKLPKYANVYTGYGYISVFYGCDTLENIEVNKMNQNLKVYDGALYHYNKEFDTYELIDFPANRKDDELEVLDKTAYAWSLDGANHLKSLVLPDSIHRVYARSSFSTFNNLKTIKYKGSSEQWKEIFRNIGACITGGKADTSGITIRYNAKSILYGEIVGVDARYKLKKKKVKPKVKVELDGKMLNKKYYTVKYKNNKNPGKASIIVSGKGIYYGTLVKKFKIVK